MLGVMLITTSMPLGRSLIRRGISTLHWAYQHLTILERFSVVGGSKLPLKGKVSLSQVVCGVRVGLDLIKKGRSSILRVRDRGILRVV